MEYVITKKVVEAKIVLHVDYHELREINQSLISLNAWTRSLNPTAHKLNDRFTEILNQLEKIPPLNLD